MKRFWIVRRKIYFLKKNFSLKSLNLSSDKSIEFQNRSLTLVSKNRFRNLVLEKVNLVTGKHSEHTWFMTALWAAWYCKKFQCRTLGEKVFFFWENLFTTGWWSCTKITFAISCSRPSRAYSLIPLSSLMSHL